MSFAIFGHNQSTIATDKKFPTKLAIVASKIDRCHEKNPQGMANLSSMSGNIERKTVAIIGYVIAEDGTCFISNFKLQIFVI
jgi:hypothetical protein